MGKDKWLEELSNKVNEFPSSVKPSLWGAIQSQIVAPTIFGISAAVVKVMVIAVSALAITSVILVTINADKVLEEKAIVGSDIIDTSGIVIIENVVNNKRPAIVDISRHVNNETVQKQQPSLNLTASIPIMEIINVSIDAEVKEGTAISQEASFHVKPIESIKRVATIPVIKDLKLVPAKEKEVESRYVATDEPVRSFLLLDLPNVFTPNGDGINDLFYLEVEGILDYSLVVLSAKGNTVWKTKDSNEKWDGRDMQGEPLPKGNYVYMITGVDFEGKRIMEYRNLRLQ
jgi:gliding motility-associated-like protein